MKAFFKLVGLNFIVKWRNLIQYWHVVFSFYGNARFRSIDCALLKRYFFLNPFTISKDFLIDIGEADLDVYGETPLTTMQLIADLCEIQTQDCVFELGCGRGRSCFWLSIFKGCRVVGIEYIPVFVEIAESIRIKYDVQHLTFQQEDMRQTDFKGATIIYFYGTCSSDVFIEELLAKFEALPIGVKIVTVSYSLLDYHSDKFIIEKTFVAPFTWGTATVYIQRKFQ